MDSLEALRNKGIGYINVDGSATREEKTLIVLGVARGGTSLLAGSLAQLGIYMGHAAAPVYEDIHLAEAFEKRRYKDAKRIIEAYNREHAVWGFKRPASIRYIKRLIKYTRNPVLLIIFKDLFSIANRNKISMKLGLIPGLNKALGDYTDIVKIINKRYCDMCLFSYEKAMNHPLSFIEELCAISSLECEETSIAKTLDFIQPDSQEYLDKTRINRLLGNVDRIQPTQISGWAYMTHRNKPVTLELFVNGKSIAETLADLPRSDVKQRANIPTELCGFSFILATPLRPNDEIHIVCKDGLGEILPGSKKKIG